MTTWFNFESTLKELSQTIVTASIVSWCFFEKYGKIKITEKYLTFLQYQTLNFDFIKRQFYSSENSTNYF